MINIYEKCKLCRELSERCVDWIACRTSKCCCANEAGANLHTTLISWILITLHYGHCQLHSLFLLYILGEEKVFHSLVVVTIMAVSERGSEGDKWEKDIGRGRAVSSVGLAILYCALHSCSLYLSVGIFWWLYWSVSISKREVCAFLGFILLLCEVRDSCGYSQRPCLREQVQLFLVSGIVSCVCAVLIWRAVLFQRFNHFKCIL